MELLSTDVSPHPRSETGVGVNSLIFFFLWNVDFKCFAAKTGYSWHLSGLCLFLQHMCIKKKKTMGRTLGHSNQIQHSVQFSSVQSLSHVQLFATPWIAAHQASLSITNSRSSLKLICIESVKPSSHLILCRPLLLPPIPPSIRVFSSESALRMRWPKYWSFSFSINPSNEHSGLIFRMDWVDLLAAQESLKSLLQHHSSKASILRCSAFFTVQLSHPYWKNHSLD